MAVIGVIGLSGVEDPARDVSIVARALPAYKGACHE